VGFGAIEPFEAGKAWPTLRAETVAHDVVVTFERDAAGEPVKGQDGMVICTPRPDMKAGETALASWLHVKSASGTYWLMLARPESQRRIKLIEAERDRLAALEAQADLVTLDQAAASVHTSKKTLERYKKDPTFPLPCSDGGGGRADYWDWAQLRPWLEQRFNRRLPLKFPRLRKPLTDN
jgi:hypothetical protein